jgi:hypothetical protein
VDQRTGSGQNLAIGQKLGVSQHTVARHVSNILCKLDLRRREEIARWVGEQTSADAARDDRYSVTRLLLGQMGGSRDGAQSVREMDGNDA